VVAPCTGNGACPIVDFVRKSILVEYKTFHRYFPKIPDLYFSPQSSLFLQKLIVSLPPMKNRHTDLTKGSIPSHLFRLAMPTIGASFMQMTYNLSDMFWLGQLGENAVAAVGAAGFFIWFGNSSLLSTKVGAEIGVSQSLGRKEPTQALRYVRHALFWATVISIFLSLITLIFAPQLISFFGIPSSEVTREGTSYLRIVAAGFAFSFVNPTFAGIYNGMGNSKLPFRYLSVGVILNLVIDPLFIFGLGPIPALGVKGAAWATIFSQAVVWIIFVSRFLIRQEMMPLHLRKFRLDWQITLRIFKLGIPVASESALFSVFAMFLAKITALFGALAIAVQSIGSQIEALSWMTSNGLATALGSFTGQNYGAGRWNRIKSGYRYALLIGAVLGVSVSVFFVLLGETVFSYFLSSPEAVRLGGLYLKILAVSQVFMIFEITTRGVFNGIGRTIPPSLTGIVFTGSRIPLAMWLSSFPALGLLGIWWAISLSSVVKGTVLPAWLLSVFKKQVAKNKNTDE
jgi:putative MATE family efflux protein